MKKYVYYFSFTVLGLVTGFLIHMLSEIVYLNLLLEDFQKYGFGWSWAVWLNIHTGSVVVLTALFGWLGFKSGKKFWRILYIEKKFSSKWGIKLKETF